MDDPEKSIDRLLHDLRERAKELNCLYEVQELLSNPTITMDEICQGIIRIIPPGWQYPDVCEAEIVYDGKVFRSEGFQASAWVQSADIVVQDEPVGRISVYYSEERPRADEGPFLKEERRLINTIAEQFGFYILHVQLKQVFQEQMRSESLRKSEWVVILDLLKRTDPDLLGRITRKMINYLGWSGIKEVEGLLEQSSLAYNAGVSQEDNRPYQGPAAVTLPEISDQVFDIASRNLSRQSILDNIQKWSREERVRFLVDVLVNPNSSLAEISSAIERYHLLASQGIELTDSREKWFKVSMIRRVVSDQPHYIRVAKDYTDIDDFGDFMHRLIFPAGSHGMLGGKSSGLFLAAQILRKEGRTQEILRKVKTPKSWYMTSDSVFYFMSYNDLEDHIEQKYRNLAQVRQDYPYIIHVFRNSALPPEIVKGLTLALEDLGDVPLIVRSSSLLEDQTGAAFAGKYKSLFIANKGTKDERLAALINAITEVFASMFGPDPIEYRVEHGLIDHHEEMGILIQEVVGAQVGQYYMPAFAGVAFSNNEFRWSSRIRREDGLVRLVPGLGTRAVDRLTDDYPVLIALRQPSLRVNATVDEVLRYSPKKIDVINLEARSFETVDVYKLLRTFGDRFPLSHELVSIYEADRLRKPKTWGTDFDKSEFVVTFEGLFSRTPFLRQLQVVMGTLQEALGGPIDIEFAHDGNDFYLLQCRSQSHSEDSIPPTIPRHLAAEDVVFTANRYVFNGIVTGVSHIVYVDPQKYAGLQGSQEFLAVGRAIGRLNQVLPRRRFILMGPGRWGSRGDIRLGVSVSYSDINNTAMLIEIARSQKGYVPEPSFGTHFFQDLVEGSIRYLPLYPDQPGIIFNERFLTGQANILQDLLPEFASLADVVRVVHVPESTGGRLLQVLMNAVTEEAVGFLVDSSAEDPQGSSRTVL